MDLTPFLLPQYACAILVHPDGRLLLELRPADARLAAGQLTCFGGRREGSESPEECLRRELFEELAWEPRRLEKRVELWVAGTPIAWFYEGSLDIPPENLRLLPGHTPRLISPESLREHPLSPWHAAVLTAWRAGQSRVELPR